MARRQLPNPPLAVVPSSCRPSLWGRPCCVCGFHLAVSELRAEDHGAMHLSPQAYDRSSNHYKFTGKERDTESGLDNFGARYYSSTQGRFMSPDWAAKPEAVPYSDLENPQSLNLYSYVGNNPLSVTDPDGHVWEWLQKLGNWLNGDGWINNRDLTEQRRSFLLERVHDDASADKVRNFTDKQVHDNYKCCKMQHARPRSWRGLRQP